MKAKVIVILAIALVFAIGVPAPRGEDTLNHAGITYFKKGDADTALNVFSGAIDLRPDDPQGYLNRGVVLIAKGRYDLALADFSRAIALNPASSEAYTNRATALMAMNQLQLAYNDSTMAIQLNPKNPEAYYNRAVAAYLGNYMDTVWFDLMNAQRLGFAPASDMMNLYRLKALGN